MTRADAKERLDQMLPPLSCYKKEIAANATLKKTQKEKLLDIVVNLEKVKNGHYQEQFDLEQVLETISKMGKRYAKETGQNGKTASKSGNKMVPFLIRQVLFYLSCKYLQPCRLCGSGQKNAQCNLYHTEQSCKISQGRFLEKLEDYQWFISKNYFSRKGITPKSYILTKQHRFVSPPFLYLQQEDRAEAIRYLTYQAGNYKTFVDVFGETGIACAALPKKDKVKYYYYDYYNDRNVIRSNLLSVLADEKLHIELITELEKLVDDIQRKKLFYTDIDFEKEIENYDERKNRIINKEEKIQKDNTNDCELNNTDILNFLALVYDDVRKKDNDFEFVWEEREYTKQELMDICYNNNANNQSGKHLNYMSFFQYYKLLTAYVKQCIDPDCLCIIKGEEKNKRTNLNKKEKEYMQYRCYCLYVYFSNFLWENRDRKKIEEKERVKYAVAKFFCLSLITPEETGMYSIFQMWQKEKKDVPKAVQKFLNRDFQKEIEAFYQEIRRFQHARENVHTIFSKHNSKDTLFYVDAPYMGEREHINAERMVEIFKEKDREPLLEALANTKGKVIYNCRMAEHINEKTCAEQKIGEMYKQIIIPVVKLYLELKKQGREKEWSVLALEGKESLEDLAKRKRLPEFMLINFEIESFASDRNGLYYTIYDLETIVEIFITNWQQKVN